MKLYLWLKYPCYSLNNSLPFTNVFVTLPWSFLSSIDVFFDFEISLSFFTIQGLLISTIQISADICIVDINKPWIVKKDKLISKSKNTSIEDKKLQGKVTNTFVNGKELFKL